MGAPRKSKGAVGNGTIADEASTARDTGSPPDFFCLGYWVALGENTAPVALDFFFLAVKQE